TLRAGACSIRAARGRSARSARRPSRRWPRRRSVTRSVVTSRSRSCGAFSVQRSPLPARATESAPGAVAAPRGDPLGALEMRAVVLRAPGRPVAVETVLLDPPHRGEVLVQVAAAGVCHSDVHLADGVLGDGRWPMVLGHEGAGVVAAVGEGVTDV